MPSESTGPRPAPLIAALAADDSSVRLRAALEAGTRPELCPVSVLVERCAVEPDFYVRDMLTWALTRYPKTATLPALYGETRSARTQARSQALHTLSKIADPTAWPVVTRALLHDPDDEVARTAWRAAVVLAPDADRPALAADLTTQLGRGGPEVQKSLSRALVGLGSVITPSLKPYFADRDSSVRVHAYATASLLADPEASFDGLLDEARRVTAPDLDPRDRT